MSRVKAGQPSSHAPPGDLPQPINLEFDHEQAPVPQMPQHHSHPASSRPRNIGGRPLTFFNNDTALLMSTVANCAADERNIQGLSRFLPGVWAKLEAELKGAQSRFGHVKGDWLNIKKLLLMVDKFEWSQEKKSVQGSQQAWAGLLGIKNEKLARWKNREFLFMEQLDRISRTIDFGQRSGNGRDPGRARSQERPLNLDSSDEDLTPDDEDKLNNPTRGSRRHLKQLPAPKNKKLKRGSNETYQGRRQFLFEAARQMESQEAALASLSVRQDAAQKRQTRSQNQVFLALVNQQIQHNEIVAALRDSHIHDHETRKKLEPLKRKAKQQLQSELCLTPLVKATILATLAALETEVEGCLVVVRCDHRTRQMWLRQEMEELYINFWPHYIVASKVLPEEDTITTADEDIEVAADASSKRRKNVRFEHERDEEDAVAPGEEDALSVREEEETVPALPGIAKSTNAKSTVRM